MAIDTKHIDSLKKYANRDDGDIDLGDLILSMVSPDHKGVSVDRYATHFTKISNKVSERYDLLVSDGAPDDAGVRLAALKHVLSDIYDYRVDDAEYEMLESADIMRVIDRAKGCPTALCVLYIHAARSLGWFVEGVNFPGLFLCRLEYEGQRMIFSPSQQCKVLAAHDLREIVKDNMGGDAELSTDYFDGLGAVDTVVNLCNHLKHRRIAMGDYASALDMILRMMAISPDEYRLLLDAGVLYARLGNSVNAAECLNKYIDCAPNHYDREEARLLLVELLGDL
ncbi:MAG: tetratricopeptide repeat protein [Alphaproteobacteria bacterium]